MTPPIRIHAPREFCPALSTKSRVVLFATEPPSTCSAGSNVCEATDANGIPCTQGLVSDGPLFCGKHLSDLKELSARWNRVHKEAEHLRATSPDTAKQKIIKLRQAVDLRRQIRNRFYKRGGDTVDYLKWVHSVETDIKAVADSVFMASMARNPTPEILSGHVATPHPDHYEAPSEKITIPRLPLDPRIPIDSLQGMADDRTVLVLKHFYANMCREAIQRLYVIAPGLNDGPELPSGRRSTPSVTDSGTDIMRAWFRIMILHDSEAEALENATKARCIHDYLTNCHASQVEMYCDFFEKAWRPHALQYLRAAICAQTLAGGDVKMVGLLGGMIPSTTTGLTMTKPCWDILYHWFPTLLSPKTLASICSDFEDYSTISKLLMMGFYRQHWEDPDSMLADCATAVYLGFIPSRKGDMSATEASETRRASVHVEARNYICGQMSGGHPLTEAFLEELRRRTERLIVVVYEGTNAVATVCPGDEELFIRRRRPAKTAKDPEKPPWIVELELEDIKNDLRMRKSMYEPVDDDSWQFIIADRRTGLPFELFDIVQDVLLMLSGDPTLKQLAGRIVRDVIPAPAQQLFIEKMVIDSSRDVRFPAPLTVSYEGNRRRCYRPESDKIIEHQTNWSSRSRSRDDDRFIRHVVDDMERAGLITLAANFEEPQTKPIVLQGADGGLDLYFPYQFGGLAPNEFTPSLTLPRKDCLLTFARSYKEQHPSAIMAKGSILTHYCAWPMPAIKRHGKKKLNFGTWEGHVYHWNVMPFDRPWSENAWQYFIQHYINSKYPFVMFYLTTFVICAIDKDDAEKVAATLLEETEQRGWRIILPNLRDWSNKIEDLKLEDMFSGIHPI